MIANTTLLNTPLAHAANSIAHRLQWIAAAHQCTIATSTSVIETSMRILNYDFVYYGASYICTDP